jgi:hypothetical protein
MKIKITICLKHIFFYSSDFSSIMIKPLNPKNIKYLYTYEIMFFRKFRQSDVFKHKLIIALHSEVVKKYPNLEKLRKFEEKYDEEVVGIVHKSGAVILQGIASGNLEYLCCKLRHILKRLTSKTLYETPRIIIKSISAQCFISDAQIAPIRCLCTDVVHENIPYQNVTLFLKRRQGRAEELWITRCKNKFYMRRIIALCNTYINKSNLVS